MKIFWQYGKVRFATNEAALSVQAVRCAGDIVSKGFSTLSIADNRYGYKRGHKLCAILKFDVCTDLYIA